MSELCYLGVDLGGTNVRAAAFNSDCQQVTDINIRPSCAQDSPSAVIEAIASAVDACIASLPVRPSLLGLAVPGHIDDLAGIVRWAPNFTREDGRIWLDVPLGQMLEERLGMRVLMGNDANLAALGEYRHGIGNNRAKCLVMLTLGTGVGGGVVLSPASVQGNATGPLLLVGANRGGAELGHVCIDQDGLGGGPIAFGALEGYCGAKAIVLRAEREIAMGTSPALERFVAEADSVLTPELVSIAAAQGDTGALSVWRDVGHYLGSAIGSFINIFAPDVVAIGGQISKAGDPLISAAIDAARDVAIPTLFEGVNIARAQRVEDAGLLGAAALAAETSHGR